MFVNYERQAEREIFKRFSKVSVTLSLVVVLCFIQAIKWDSHFLSIIPLQIKSMMSSLSAHDADELAKICLERKNLDCAESALQSEATTQVEALTQLGKIQMQRQKFRESANSFGSYFRSGGLSVDASYDYAKVLGQLGMIDQASQYYERVLASKVDALQVTVTQSYVKMLIANKRSAQAKTVIDGIRAKGGNASLFMESEYAQLEK